MIAVLDYNAGNIASVCKAFKYIGKKTQVTRDSKIIERADALVIPGVGSMGNAMDNLMEYGLDYAVKEFAYSGKAVLGICLGMQILFEYSDEGIKDNEKNSKGLGILEGRVLRFSPSLPVKIPHMGWNKICGTKDSILKENSDVYFVHSYYAKPFDESIITSFAFHGERFTSSVRKDNIRAMQFHPEKSGEEGINILKKWVKTI